MIQKISEEIICKTGIFDVAKVKLESDKRTNIIHSVIKFVNTVSLFPITKEGKIVVVKQYRTPLNKVLIEIPAGKIDKGESPEDCAKREMEEETGYRIIKLVEIYQAYVSCGYSDEKMTYYAAIVEKLTKNERTHFPDEDEELDIIELSPEDALKMIFSGEIEDAKTVSMIMAYVDGTIIKKKLES